MRLVRTKVTFVFAAIIAFAMSCADEETVTPHSSTIKSESDENIVYDDPDFVAKKSEDAGRSAVTQNLPVKTFTVYLARTSNATAGSVNFKLYDGNTLIKQSSSKNVNTLTVWSGNLSDVSYGLLSYSPNGLELDTAKTYRLEIHCTGCESDANKQVVWWSANANQYPLGTGQTKTGESWTSNNNDFSFKIQNVNSDGTLYTSRAQYVREKVYSLNTGVIQAQTFIPELGDNYIIQFPDANLASAVRRAAQISSDAPITYGDAKRIEHITQNGPHDGGAVSNLEGLQYIKNLEDLTLVQSTATSISQLKNLRKLETLRLQAPEVTDITPLSSLHSLRTLELVNTNMTSATALVNLTNLTDLTLRTTKLSDITSLGALTKLIFLNIDSEQLANITPLEVLTKLEMLYLSSNQITLIPSLNAASNLWRLALRSDHLTDISAVSTLTQLTRFELTNAPVSDISPIEGLVNLTFLALNSTTINNISLENLVKLERLYIRSSHLISVASLVNLPALKYLYLNNNQITDVLLLGLVDSLVELDLRLTPVSQQDQTTLRNHLPNTTITF
jgi:Leucine-rich repeat (LRR) protein